MHVVAALAGGGIRALCGERGREGKRKPDYRCHKLAGSLGMHEITPKVERRFSMMSLRATSLRSASCRAEGRGQALSRKQENATRVAWAREGFCQAPTRT